MFSLEHKANNILNQLHSAPKDHLQNLFKRFLISFSKETLQESQYKIEVDQKKILLETKKLHVSIDTKSSEVSFWVPNGLMIPQKATLLDLASKRGTLSIFLKALELTF